MDFYELVETRKSVRQYRPDPVEEEKLGRMLEAARLAPSASNTQDWRFVVVREEETRKKLARAASGQAFVAQSPVVIACCAEDDGHIMRCGIPRYPVDVSIAVEHMALAATAEGLGTCWVCALDPDEVSRILHIPKSIRVIALLTMGYAEDPSPLPKNRLPLKEIVRWERWD
jgi:nitroreductase